MTQLSGRISQRKTEMTASTLPEIGKIKIGEKVKNNNGVEYPVSLDYFKATGNYAQEFNKICGDKCQRVTISFISDNLQEVCFERYEVWDKGKRYGYGDGSIFTVWSNEEKKYIENLKEDDKLVIAANKIGKGWEVYLTLRFVLLQMKGIMGYWTFQTKGGKTTIPQIIKAFDFVRERANTIIGFPFNLIVEKKKGYSPDSGRAYPTVSLVPNFTNDAIEMVSNYIEQGGQIQKITTNMIEQKTLIIEQNKQLSNG